MTDKKGVLLMNVGTPDAPTVSAVRAYLREFLGDPYVLAMPSVLRFLLLNCVILPFRPKQSAKAYQAIWTEEGSPLRVYSMALLKALRLRMSEEFEIEFAMRYGNPSLSQAVHRLKEAGCVDWVVVPLYPQYAEATTESSWGALSQAVQDAFVGEREPTLHELKPFYEDPCFITAWQQVATQKLVDHPVDHVLMSYHGLPEHHLKPPVCQMACNKQTECCSLINVNNANCYRAQCYATSRAIAEALCLSEKEYTVSFQSRLGRTPWIGPDTEAVITDLYESGIRRLAVMTPSFVADCLETLEEIGLRLREQWLAMKGTEFVLIPCLNEHPAWVKGLEAMIQMAMVKGV